MKRATCFLILGVLVFGVSVAVEIDGVLEKSLGGLIARPNPGLSGIRAAKLTFMPSGDARVMDSAFWEGLGGKLKEELSGVGLKVHDPNDSILSPRPFDLPQLVVDVDVRRFESEQLFFSIRVSLGRPVYIVTRDEGASGVRPGVMVKADVWTISSSICPASPEDLQGLITEVALREVEAFTAAWVASNPPDKKGPDTDATMPEPKASEKPTASAMSKVQYVGSKNSSVFHSRDCRSVKRISAKNLIVYKTRDEAIKAGKRPCLLCNP